MSGCGTLLAQLLAQALADGLARGIAPYACGAVSPITSALCACALVLADRGLSPRRWLGCLR